LDFGNVPKPIKWYIRDKCRKLRNALADKFNEAERDNSNIQEIVKNDYRAKEIKDLFYKRSKIK